MTTVSLISGALKGDSSRFQEIVTQNLEKTARRDPQASFFVAGLHALAGPKQEALDWLSNAVDRGFINYPFIAEHDPLLESIRGEPRFRDILREPNTSGSTSERSSLEP